MLPFKAIWGNLVFFSTLLVLAIVGAFFFIVVDHGSNALRDIREKAAGQVADEMKRMWLDRAEELTASLASSSSRLIPGLDVEGLKEMASIAAAGTGILYVYIHDGEGRFLVDTTIGAPKVGEFAAKPFARRATARNSLTIQEGIDFMEVAEPVYFAMEKVGTVRIGFSLTGLSASTGAIRDGIKEQIDFSIDETRKKTLSLGFIALVATIVAVGLFSHRLSQPLRELARGTEKVASGDLTFRAEVGARDEIGELARSFNRMTEDLEEATVSRNYVDNIIKNMTGCLIISSPDGHIGLVNQATLDLLGYEEEVLINLHLGNIFSEEEMHPSRRIFEVIRQRGLKNAEAFLRARDGRKIPVLLSGSVISNAPGEEQGIVCIALDITDRKKNEEAINGYVQQLEHNNHLLKLFTDILSHDLLNPANIITHMSAMVIQQDPSRHRDEMEMVQRNARKLTQLIKDASDFARVESGEPLARERINLLGLLSAVIGRYRPQLEERGMSIDYRPNGEAAVLAHPMIEDIFANLLSNTFKYTPEGTAITVAVEAEGDDWIVTVADNGEGIPDEYKEAVFERFERREKTGVKGSGLGLAIARRLTDLHDGAIWIEDNPGGGCRFKVRLPMSDGRGEEKAV